MSPPPPAPDDDAPPPAGREVIEPSRDSLLDDPLFAELVEAKPGPDLKVGPPAPPPVAAPADDLPLAEVVPARPKPPPAGPPRRVEEPTEPPKPQVFAACAVLGCFGLGFVASMSFLGWAALTLLSGLPDDRGTTVVHTGARPGPVESTKYAADSGQIQLAGTVDAVGRAAAGRYLLLRTSRTGEVHVFDPNVGDVIAKFDTGGGRSLFAGSASKLFVFRTDDAGNSLERWDLETRVKEHSVQRPRDALPPVALAVGAGTDGPLYLVNAPINGAATVRVIDADTLAEKAAYGVPNWLGAAHTHVRASDDGLTLTASTASGAAVLRFPSPQAAPTAVVLRATGPNPPKYATPARNGALVFTPRGLFSPDGALQPGPKRLTFPTAQGTDLFLSQVVQDAADPTPELRLHLTAAAAASVPLSSVGGPKGVEMGELSAVTADQRVHLWPAAGLAVVVSTGTPTRLLLTKVDVKELLSDLVQTHVVIGSDPSRWAPRSAEWRYRPAVWTNGDGPTAVKLVESPPGMQVKPNGEVVWTPGTGAARTSVVRLRVEVGDVGTEQQFRLTVLDDPDDE
ncbi:YncE family protein [Urbifossiella limnaea]|uniref:Uncharacterized protein n=1 Tax=Urbifossiella limnaea TaxID=2528023 RepID=A0A517XSB8_9BACT|nr:hypothetical protein [Urbifossiella limnaea]QDU20362.1 hypothetical protein ETAA1_23140 [Urbifossiella limnaea]